MTTAVYDAAILDSPPIVLLVEDDESLLELRADLFKSSGCTPIPVRSPDEALRELRASPGVDLMLTDIHLRPQRGDRSGIELARTVRREWTDLPVAGYSAYFQTGEIADADTRVFERAWVKGEMDFIGIQESVRECRRFALAHRQHRFDVAASLLHELRRKHEAERPEVEMLRELVPGIGASADIEQELLDAGYRLRLVDANVHGLAKPIIVWLLRAEGRTEAEVYAQPALYAAGGDAADAILNLVELMHLYTTELRGDPDAVAGPALSLKAFLDRVVGPEPE